VTPSEGTGEPVAPDAVFESSGHRVKAPIDKGAPGVAGSGPRPRWQRLVAWAVLVVGVLGVLFLVATARLFVWPPTDTPAKVDAILALGGDPGQLRAKEGLSLAEAGYAPVVVVSRGGYPPVPCPTAKSGVRVICFRANPLNTRGEVEYGTRLAAQHHWTSMLMVPERDQATRARLLFRRCSDMRLVVVPVSAHGGTLLYDVAYEWAALAKAFIVHTSC
jgi:uncharacterized SAM-binding protein YcdF (DUF218 family)